MKNLKITLAAMALIATASACHMGKGHTTISESDGKNYVKIEYSGRVGFNSDSTAISKISSGGYVKYVRNNQTFIARNSSHGEVIYRINDGDSQTKLNGDDKQFLASAVKDMIRHGHYNDGR